MTYKKNIQTPFNHTDPTLPPNFISDRITQHVGDIRDTRTQGWVTLHCNRGASRVSFFPWVDHAHRSSPHLLGSATPPDPLTFGSLSWPIPAARSAPSRPGTKGGVAPRPAQVRRLVLRGLRIEPWLLQRGICPTWRSLQAARHNSYERLGFLRACRELGGF